MYLQPQCDSHNDTIWKIDPRCWRIKIHKAYTSSQGELVLKAGLESNIVIRVIWPELKTSTLIFTWKISGMSLFNYEVNNYVKRPHFTSRWAERTSCALFWGPSVWALLELSCLKQGLWLVSGLSRSNSAPEGSFAPLTPTVIKPQCPIKRLFSGKVLIVPLSVKKVAGG